MLKYYENNLRKLDIGFFYLFKENENLETCILVWLWQLRELKQY